MEKRSSYVRSKLIKELGRMPKRELKKIIKILKRSKT
jgi:hypothetical protein